MSNDRYQKGMDKLKELTVPNEQSPTGHMEIGESFKDIAGFKQIGCGVCVW